MQEHPVKLSKDEIVDKFNGISDKLKDLAIDFVILAGSTSSDLHQWWSDIDIFVSLPKYNELPSQDKIEVFNTIHTRLYGLTNFDNIELSFIQTLPIAVKFSAIRTGILLVEYREQSYSDFKYHTMKEYYDYKIWIDRFHSYAEGYA